MHSHARPISRRRFLGGVTLVGTAGLLGFSPRRATAEPPPETTRLRLAHDPVLCFAPQFVADELLRLEGFTDVQYIKTAKGPYLALAAGEADINTGLAGQFILRLDAGDPLVILTGTHAGCFELFATERIRSVKDLKGKTVAVPGMGTSHHMVVVSMAAYVGLDPRSDITFVTPATAEAIQLLAEGKIDAMMGFPPEPQELRARQIGHVVINTTTDRPWSQYFCCMLASNAGFVRKHPVATKRAVRALLKANALCAQEPERIARIDAEDTVRFYALRLHEAGMIKTTPQKIIAQGTDWRFLNELKRELKA
ncbi:MAG: ABC transporter substrate-binding protein [Betaproteobacteria bacterium]|nr:MAG: ABC transporter substrate-binding protein [Betaproteobacteria bacterium]